MSGDLRWQSRKMTRRMVCAADEHHDRGSRLATRGKAAGTHLRRGQTARPQLPENLREVHDPLLEKPVVRGGASHPARPEVLRLALELSAASAYTVAICAWWRSTTTHEDESPEEVDRASLHEGR